MASEWQQCCGETVIGIERRGWYDGVAYFECGKCGTGYPRGNPPQGLFAELWERRLAELPFARRPAPPQGGEGR